MTIRSFLSNLALLLGGAWIAVAMQLLPAQGVHLPSLAELLNTPIALVGWVFWPLLAAGIGLLWLSVRHFLVRRRSEPLSPHEQDLLAKIEWVSPLLGLLGTLTALGGAMAGISLNNGLDEALTSLTQSVGQALWSSVVGVILSMIAGLQLKHVANAEEDF